MLLAGDISFIRVTPLAAYGLLSGWIEAIDILLGLNPEIVVPGHGPIGDREVVDGTITMIGNVSVRLLVAAISQ